MSNLNDKRVIVVEDNVDNYNLILRLLTSMGIEHCEWVSSGWILLDIQLPYEDGFEVHQNLREHPILKDTLIVAVTANASESYMQQAINDGFDGFIGKPIDPDRFPDQVRRALEGNHVWEWH